MQEILARSGEVGGKTTGSLGPSQGRIDVAHS